MLEKDFKMQTVKSKIFDPLDQAETLEPIEDLSLFSNCQSDS